MAQIRQLQEETFDALAEELASMTNVPHVLQLIDRLRTMHDELDQENTDLRRECSSYEKTADAYETRLDDISATLDMVQTGYRDFSDLARTIQA